MEWLSAPSSLFPRQASVARCPPRNDPIRTGAVEGARTALTWTTEWQTRYTQVETMSSSEIQTGATYGRFRNSVDPGNGGKVKRPTKSWHLE